jgi:hypothetical protein
MKKHRKAEKLNNVAVDSDTNAKLETLCDEQGWTKKEAVHRAILFIHASLQHQPSPESTSPQAHRKSL